MKKVGGLKELGREFFSLSFLKGSGIALMPTLYEFCTATAAAPASEIDGSK